MKHFITVFFFSLLFFNTAYSQKWEVGAGIGGTLYRGELAPGFKPLQVRPGGQAFVRYNFSPVFDLRVNVLFTGIHGSDQGSNNAMAKLRNTSFNNSISEISFLAEYNFFDFRAPHKTFKATNKWSPYLLMGLGVFRFTAYEKDQNYSMNLCIPLGVGVKWAYSKQVNFGVEAGYRITFTDQLDNVYERDGSNTTQTSYTDNDAYLFAGVQVSYTFYSVKCPEK